MIPRRKPLFTVGKKFKWKVFHKILINFFNKVGAPIDVPKLPTPSQDEIDKYHTEFCTKIMELFETHKAKYIKNHKNVNLVLE